MKRFRSICPRTIRVAAGDFERGDELQLTDEEARNLLRIGAVEPLPEAPAPSRRERAARSQETDEE